MEVIKKVINDKSKACNMEDMDFIDKKFSHLSIDTILKVKSSEELKALGVPDDDIEKIADKNFLFSQGVLASISFSLGGSFGFIDGVTIKQSYVDVVKEDEVEYVLYDIISSLSDDEKKLIKEEMISKLTPDLKLIKDMLTRYKENGNGGSSAITNIALNKILNTWAEEKMFLYLSMGRNISINKEVDIVPSKSEIISQWRGMCDKYCVGRFLTGIKYESISENSINVSDFYTIVINSINDVEGRREDIYKDMAKGLYDRNKNSKMKLTKCISRVFNYNKLDISVSQVLQSKNQKQRLWMSIHPLDYLCCSNTTTWTSCHKAGGQYQGGPISYLVDNCTLMMFSCGNSKAEILGGVEWYDKRWRELVYVNPKTYTATFYREYPTKIGNLRDEARYFYEETVSSFLSVENKWEDRKFKSHLLDKGTSNGSILHYNDPLRYSSEDSNISLHTISLENTDYKLPLQVGSKGICLKCGKPSVISGKTLLCEKCNS